MSWLDTLDIDVTTPGATFTATVPGDRLWTIRTVYAVAQLDAGGAPSRYYQLEIATSTGTVALVAAPNAAGDSAQDEITWANCPAASIAVTGVGVVVAPFSPPVLYPGYVLTGTIVNAVLGDAWTTARVWYDYVLTSGGVPA